MESVLVGVSGVKRNACAAVCVDGDVTAVCEQERVTRVRGIGLTGGTLPGAAVEEVLSIAGKTHSGVESYVLAERGVRPPLNGRSTVLDHHQAHAATAFLTSPFATAAVLICDSSCEREVSVWLGDGSGLHDQGWSWHDTAFASLYSAAAELFGLPPGQEHRLEALARLGRGDAFDRLQGWFRYSDGTLQIDARWRERLAALIDSDRRDAHGQPVETAAAFQRTLGELLLAFAEDVRAAVGLDTLCVGGGLFYNTYFTTLLRKSGIFRDVFVPINPGNAGLAVGGTMLVSREGRGIADRPAVSPFLGPGYDAEAVKVALDGCKLSYSFASEAEVLDQTTDALLRGQLVGWYQGQMEWGHRALGHRSILAYPDSPYVLDNLNFYLRKRERWRAFGVSTCMDAAPRFFCGPPASRYMEFEYTLREDRVRRVVPKGATAIRVQTVDPELHLFWALHKRVEQATGLGVLVNTSFNGFQEPIVCTPRDAVRVFFGTGLDVLVMDRFLLKK